MEIVHILLCLPTYFRVDYSINPWMKIGSVNHKKANQQWKNLRKTYEKLGIKVSFIEQELNNPDMVFATDQALFIKKDTFLFSRFRYPERQNETPYYKKWFLQKKYKLIEIDKKDVFFEGSGDCLVWKKGVYFLGVGHRNSKNIEHILTNLTQKRFIQLHLKNKHFYHLDTCLFILNSETAFYYPPAFDQKSLKILKESFSDLVAIPKKEADNFALNCVTHEKFVLIQAGNSFMKQELEKRNYVPLEIDVSEFMKAGGGIHCLTQILDYNVE